MSWNVTNESRERPIETMWRGMGAAFVSVAAVLFLVNSSHRNLRNRDGCAQGQGRDMGLETSCGRGRGWHGYQARSMGGLLDVGMETLAWGGRGYPRVRLAWSGKCPVHDAFEVQDRLPGVLEAPLLVIKGGHVGQGCGQV